MEENAGQVVTARVEFPADVLRPEKQPGQGLINTEPERTPGPLQLRNAETAVVGVVQEVRLVVPVDETVLQAGDEGGDHDQGERNRNQPGAAVRGRQRFRDPARHRDSRPLWSPGSLDLFRTCLFILARDSGDCRRTCRYLPANRNAGSKFSGSSTM